MKAHNIFWICMTTAVFLLALFRKRMVERDKKSQKFKQAKKPIVKRHSYRIPSDAPKKLIENWTHHAQEQVKPAVIKKTEIAQDSEVQIS